MSAPERKDRARMESAEVPMAGGRPLMVIGPSGAGKSTLLAALGLMDGRVKKTEALVYHNQAIDTPGEMLSIPRYYNALILNSARAGLVLFLMEAGRPVNLPARLALALRAPTLGVVSKVDQSGPEGRDKARQMLRQAGVQDIVAVSSQSGEGLVSLKEFIAKKMNGVRQP